MPAAKLAIHRRCRVAKDRAPLLPHPFQYWGWWWLLCFALQSLFAYRLARELAAPRLVALTAAGFAVIASPVRYGESGVMSFMVSQDGVVYEKDLGPDTWKIAASMSVFDPDPSWTKSDTTP